MRPADIVMQKPPFGWRWLLELMWRLERAFERSRAAGKAEDDTRIRIFFILALFAFGFMSLAIGAARTALFSDAGRRAGLVGVPAGSRADIVDRNGALLAVDLTHYGLYLDPREIWNSDETRRVLGPALPKLAPGRLERALKSDHREYLLGGLTPAERDRIRDLGLPGVSFEAEQHRVYPLGATAAHIIGFADRGGEGLSGAELALNDDIRRQAGGQPIALSIDLRVQAALEDELKKAVDKFHANGAVGLITDARTGEILAMSSVPDFDPNAVGQAGPAQLKNQAGASVFEMGSVFKILTVATGLDSGVATLNSSYNVDSLQLGQRTIHDFHAIHGNLTVPGIFIHSSNIGTAKLALQTGAPTVTKYFRRFGLFAAAPIELSESTRPIVPKTWPDTTLASASFGQAISVTPLNVAAAMGSVVNGGHFVPLTIRKGDPAHIPEGQRVISEDTARKMLDLMRLNVTSKEGSGGQADIPGLSVGGKTGSAQKVINGRYAKDVVVASFAAVFPTDGPMDRKRYFVFVLIDEPKGIPETYGFRTAGWNAAPAAGRVIERAAPFLGVRRATAAPAMIAAAAAPPAPGSALAEDESGGDR